MCKFIQILWLNEVQNKDFNILSFIWLFDISVSKTYGVLVPKIKYFRYNLSVSRYFHYSALSTKAISHDNIHENKICFKYKRFTKYVVIIIYIIKNNMHTNIKIISRTEIIFKY